MNTGGPTGPAENIEAPRHQNQSGSTKMEQVRRMGKYCKDLSKAPTIQEKIKEFLQGRLTKSQLEEVFKSDLSGKSIQFKKQVGIDEGENTLDTFLCQTKCFENQFMYEITHNTKIKESAKEEMLDGCIETLRDEYHITASQEQAVRAYLAREESAQGLNIFLESGKKRSKVLKKALPSPLTEKTLDDIDFNDLHSKIANLSPTDPNSRRIQAIWSTMMGGIRIQEGEDVKAAFKRIQEEGGEGDLTADYEAFFSCPDSLISKTNKDRIRDFLVRQYVPTISLENLQEIDQEAAKKLLAEHPINEHTETSPDADWESAIKAQRVEFARQSRGVSLVTNGISMKHLDIKTQLRILGGLSSARRLKQKNEFARGQVGGANIPNINYEDAFESTHAFKPDEVMTDDGLIIKLEEAHGNKIKNLDKFAPGAVMRWKNKGSGDKEMIGYYVIEHTLGNILSADGESGDIKLRFLGNNQNGGKLSRAGIPQTKTGPQFFDYLDGCADSGEIDFIDDGGALESEELKKVLSTDGASFYTDNELKHELKTRYSDIDIVDEVSLQQEVDALLYGHGNSLESDDIDKRKLCSGMTFALCKDGELDTFEIEDIIEPSDGNPGYVNIWDGWGHGEDARRQLTFREFVNQLKHFKTSHKAIYRVPFGKAGDRMGQEQFNALIQSKHHTLSEGKEKKNAKIAIQEGKFGEYDKNGIFHEKTIVKVGDNKDLHILGIDGSLVTVSQGTFKQTKWDEKAGKFTQKPEFHGTHPYQMPLTLLWTYLQKNSYTELTKEDTAPKYKKNPEKGGNMSWMNILLHAHSFGTIMHGDLWKGPWKAFEEQHHKDHAFAGKLTAALAVEKLQRVPGVGGLLFDYDWANLMVGDANSSFQSYLDELVGKVDGMGSYHRTRMIKKWAQSEHFPSPKFMAAMFASMKIFGQLYPYDDGVDDVRSSHGNKEWFWYNSMTHTGAMPLPEGWPSHMPPHNGDKWPTKNGQELTEVSACYELFGKFKHPLLQNLGRRYQKYMNAGHKELKDGGEGNLDQRVTMEEKLDWMVSSVISGKPTEAFGQATEKWLSEGYPTQITTMPYAALLFGAREQHLLPQTQEHILKELFQSGSHVPMFPFAQSKNLGDIFRKTGVAFAYSIDGSVGRELESLVEYASHNRIHKNSKVNGEDWAKKFKKFWNNHGAQLMDKMTGMRDPMFNIMMNDPQTFGELIDAASPEKKKQYEKLRENKGVISAYYNRLKDTYDSPGHVEMNRGKGFYSGDNFRFREKSFDNGYPIFWINWPDYLEQLDKGFLQGSAEKTGDGIFNEVRGFIDAMPDMAEKMVKEMGITQEPERTKTIHKVCEKLYAKNVKEKIRPTMPSIGTSPEAAYCSIPAMILGMAPLKKISVGGTDTPDIAKYAGYHERMGSVIEKAEQMEKTDFPASIRYRTQQWKKWQEIVKNRTSLENIDATPDSSDYVFTGNRSSILKPITLKTLDETEAVLRNKHHTKDQRGLSTVPDRESLLQGSQGSQQGQDDDETVPPPFLPNQP